MSTALGNRETRVGCERGWLGRLPAPIAAHDLGWGWAPAGACASAGRTRESPAFGAQAIQLLVASLQARGCGSRRAGSRPPRPPTPLPARREPLYLPDGRHTPDEHHCASAARRLATAGSSEAPACQCALPWSGSRQWGWGVGGLGLEIPTAVSRNRAPGARQARAERPARGTEVRPGNDQHLRRAPAGAPALRQINRCDGRRKAPEPTPSAADRRLQSERPLP